MTIEFIHTHLWNTITLLAQKAKRRHVAVAYLGTNANELLPLSDKDLLIVDMSLSAVRSGQTNPYEVEKYLKKGVEVHSYSNLHAKVFVFDKKVIVGSPNVSSNSQNHLTESAIITNDSNTASAVRGFIFSLRGEQVTPAYIKSCKHEYQAPKINKKTSNREEPILWIQRTHPLKKDDTKRDKAVKNGTPIAKQRLLNPKQYHTDWVSSPISSQLIKKAKLNDLYIQVWQEENEPPLVYPPARIINFKPYVTERGAKQTIVYLEYPKNPKCIEWKDFKKALQQKKIGFSKVSNNIQRTITDIEIKQLIIGLWTSIHDD